MAARSKDTRKEILAKLYHFCKFNLDPNGFWNGEKLPNYEANISLEMREAVASMNIDEWVEEANKTIEAYNMTRKTEKKPTDPVQASIDFTYADMEKLLGKLAPGVYGIRDKDGNDIPLPDEVSLGVLEMVANCVRMWGRIPNYKAFKIQRDAMSHH